MNSLPDFRSEHFLRSHIADTMAFYHPRAIDPKGGFFHYFRDDGPLYELMLDETGRRELDALWREFDFVTGAPVRQYTSFVWFERTDSPYMRDREFDFARSEDKDVTSEPKITRLPMVA